MATISGLVLYGLACDTVIVIMVGVGVAILLRIKRVNPTLHQHVRQHKILVKHAK